MKKSIAEKITNIFEWNVILIVAMVVFSAMPIDSCSASAVDLGMTDITVPDAPTNLQATGGYKIVTLTWTRPASDGGSSITSYQIWRGTVPGGETFLVSVSGLVTSATDWWASPGVTYYYKVRAVNSIGPGPFSNEASASSYTLPTAPRNLVATSGDGFITLTWIAPYYDGGAPILTYRIYRGLTSDEKILLTEVPGNTFSFGDSGVIGGTTYFYHAKATNAAGESPASNEVAATAMTAPDAPTNLQAIGGYEIATLTWTAPVSDGGSPITSNQIWRGTISGGETFLCSVPESATSATDWWASPGVTYYYKVRAVNSIGPGLFSNEASATSYTLPTAPRNLVATSGDGFITLTWIAPYYDGGAPILAYRIYRGLTSDGKTLIDEVPGSFLTYVDTDVVVGTTYFYYVTAANTADEGPASNEVTVTAISVPDAPTNLQAIGGYEIVTLTWGPPTSDGGSSITSYQIWRGTTSGEETYLYSVSGSAISATDWWTSIGVTYYYKVRAVNLIGPGPFSNEASAASYTLPTAPRNLFATSGDGSITLTWIMPNWDGGNPLISYRLYRGTSSGSESYLTDVSGSETSYVDVDVTIGTAYYYHVTATNAAGEGPASNEAWTIAIDVPGAPINLVAIAGKKKVKLDWEMPANDGGSTIIAYKIYRGTSSGGETFLIAVSSKTFKYTDDNAQAGLTYYYQVCAVNSAGEGPRSNEAVATPGKVLILPSSLLTFSLNDERAVSSRLMVTGDTWFSVVEHKEPKRIILWKI